MPQPTILIHEFVVSGDPRFDDEGDQMLGFYFQFADQDDQPITHLIGPYQRKGTAEKAAVKAFHARDF